MNLLYPALAIGAIGLFFGALLAFASIVFKVEKDERIDQICELLPGANCGGCGYAGCSALAEAIVKDGVPATKCNLMTPENNAAICAIMGIQAGKIEKKSARLKCAGNTEACKPKFDFTGVDDCFTALQLAGGPKTCEFGCMGLGSCVAACDFDAIEIKDGIAFIHQDKCVGCGKCVNSCPKNIIELAPVKDPIYVACNSTDKGALVMKYCKAGCIGCKKCEKACQVGAITVTGSLAHIDYAKCSVCGACVEACPKKVIHRVDF